MCVQGDEGQLDIAGVCGTGRYGSPRQGAPATMGTRRLVQFEHSNHAILQRGVMEHRSAAISTSRLHLDTIPRGVQRAVNSHNTRGTSLCPDNEQHSTTLQVPNVYNQCTPLEVDLISLWLCLLVQVYIHNSHPSLIYATILFLLNIQFLNIIA